jgi:hypothetical protein
MRRKKRSWWWSCLRIAFVIWLAFAIVRVLKQPYVLILGLCSVLIAVGLAVEALHS